MRSIKNRLSRKQVPKSASDMEMQPTSSEGSRLPSSRSAELQPLTTGTEECQPSTSAGGEIELLTSAQDSQTEGGAEKTTKKKESKPNPARSGGIPNPGLITSIRELILGGFRVLVSQNRRRIITDGFDLDLTYITDRIVAMGYPADSKEAYYRNSMKHITRFFERRHSNHYKVFNLTLYQPRPFQFLRRGQYSYDPANFQHRVISFEMTDHHPPRLELMAPFCREVHEYLNEDPRNVVAVHCKAGKGRTGVMICAYLTYCQFYPTPRQNLDYYSVVRTRNNKGVTIPSQRRYIYYYAHLRERHLNYFPLRIQLVGVYFERPTKSGKWHRDSFSLRVANGDVDVYFGDAIQFTNAMWENEQKAWGVANTTALGPDAYDPEHPEDETKNELSRRAFGWTIPAESPVFLEGDVRVDLYLQKKYINIIKSNNKTKVGHVWFNTMFSCPGACGTRYVHGDQAHPYPEGETTIAHKIKKETPARDATSPVTDESVAGPSSSGARSPQDNLEVGQDDQSPLSSARSQASSVKKERKGSRIEQLTTHARKLFSSGESVSARSTDSDVNAPLSSARSRRSHPEKLNLQSTPPRPPLNVNELEIPEPPGLDQHCSLQTVETIYGDDEEVIPRYAIREMLQEAHNKQIVRDVYNERLRSLPTDGVPVQSGPDGRPTASGPNRITRNPDEHVDYYPVVEIDRAFKNNAMSNGFKMIVVTKCIEKKTYRLCEAFLNVTHEKQQQKNLMVYEKSQRGKPYVDTEPKLAEMGAGRTWPPVIQYGNCGMQGVGGEATNLTDDAYKNDARAKDDRTCRYFYKQRKESMSRFPSASHTCPLTGLSIDGSVRSERLNTITTIGSTGPYGVVGERSLTPVDKNMGTSSAPGASMASLVPAAVPIAESEGEQDLGQPSSNEELDLEAAKHVSTYHPNQTTEVSSDGSVSSEEERFPDSSPERVAMTAPRDREASAKRSSTSDERISEERKEGEVQQQVHEEVHGVKAENIEKETSEEDTSEEEEAEGDSSDEEEKEKEKEGTEEEKRTEEKKHDEATKEEKEEEETKEEKEKIEQKEEEDTKEEKGIQEGKEDEKEEKREK